MKRAIAILLTLASLAVLLPAGGLVSAAKVTKKPFYMVNDQPVFWESGDYVYDMPFFHADYSNGQTETVVSWVGSGTSVSDIELLAEELKYDFDLRPEGTRYIFMDVPYRAIDALTEDYMYFDVATQSIKAWMENFLAEYKRIGGKLDGISIDVEYIYGSSYELWSIIYKYRNKNCYWDIVNNPKYKTVLRPKLEKWGYQFWPEDKQDSEKSEVWASCPEVGTDTKEYYIWNHIMHELLTESLNEAIFEPMLKHYPNALLSDYGRIDSYGWQKTHNSGMMGHQKGNSIKVGNVSNRQCYPYEPWENHIGQFSTPAAFNDAKYAATPFNVALWGVTSSKNMYEADSNHRISSWMTFFNFQPNHPGSSSNTPYYSETIYHIGLLDPQPFLGYIIPSEVATYGAGNPDPKVSDYEYAIQVVAELMAELTRVAGYSDRKPIYIPNNWNSHFMLSGMYANGRNIWRITPDIYTGTSVEDFKVKDSDPTFQIDGQTITFPQGAIIADSKISQVGTCGYWVETPADVTPVITGSVGRYEKFPSFYEDFESYAIGTDLYIETSDAWEGADDAVVTVEAFNGGKAVALTGTVQLNNIGAPRNITAGDSYAKQQVWQVNVTLPESGDVNLLRCADEDWGLKMTNGKVYCDDGGTYKQMPGVTVSAGGTYIVKRELDNRTEGQCISTYTVCDDSGKVLGSLQCASPQVPATVSKIFFNAKNVTGYAYLDNYKIYLIGLTTDFEVYSAATGFTVDAEEARNEDTAYRLSWLNATDEDVVAKVYNNGKLIREFTMGVGQDGVITDVVKADGNPILLTVTTGYPADGDGIDAGQTPAPTTPVDGTDPTDPADGTGSTNPADKNDGTDATQPSDDKPGTTTKPGKKGGLNIGLVVVIILATVLVAGGAIALLWFVIKPKWLPDLFKKPEPQAEETIDADTPTDTE